MKNKTIPGMRFHRLVTVARVHGVPGKTLWECLCDCGKTKVASSSTLSAGYTKSCGCLHHEKMETWRAKRRANWKCVDLKAPCVPIFSEEDKDLSSCKWRFDTHGYAQHRVGKKLVFAHHEVLLRMLGRRPDWTKREVTDHKNRIKLDCRRENLHIVTPRENLLNRPPRPKRPRRFAAQPMVRGTRYYLGYFDTPEEARRAAVQFREKRLSGL